MFTLALLVIFLYVGLNLLAGVAFRKILEDIALIPPKVKTRNKQPDFVRKAGPHKDRTQYVRKPKHKGAKDDES